MKYTVFGKNSDRPNTEVHEVEKRCWSRMHEPKNARKRQCIKNVEHARAHMHTTGSSIRAMRIRGREHVEMSVHPDTTGENTA